MSYKKWKEINSGRKADTSTVREAMRELLDAYQLKNKYEQTQLINSWERLMGAPIARRTDKLSISNRKLYVKLNSAALKQELNLSKSKILSLFMREFGELIVDDVVFL
jgi:predicted nucleic acid-binding Zn ribbon protein